MDLKKAGMIGCGSMGGGMTLLFAENGVTVSCQDPDGDAVDKLIQSAKDQGISPLPVRHDKYKDFCDSLDSPKVIFLSLPHGSVGDTVVAQLHPYLAKGDIIIDCSNENWNNTERRQGKLISQGVYYLGVGVSGGYQAARRGPSMSPGGEEKAIELMMPFFEKVAAKGPTGKPCVARIGEGGAGMYVKMIHNGIEHGIMSGVSEAWEIMNTHMGMGYDEIGEVYRKWASEGEMKNMFLVSIAADICATKDKDGHHILGDVQDKVVQDITGEEGTGIWSNTEATVQHVPAPTLSTAHFLRIVSSDRNRRERVKKTFHGSFTTTKIEFKDDSEKQHFLEDLRLSVYATCLASYVQGMDIIDKSDSQNKWAIDYEHIVQIWRNGCIIRADHIADLLENIFEHRESHEKVANLLYEETIANEFKNAFESLKRVVLKGIEVNAVVPSMSASLEYLKYCGNLELPTQFYEAELDYFGSHMYDKKGEPNTGGPTEGKHHYEWKAA